MCLRLTCVLIMFCFLAACASENKQNANVLPTQADSVALSVDEKIQASRKQKEGQLNMSSAVRYAASNNMYSRWGDLAMMSKYGKAAHNFGYTLLAPTNTQLQKLDQGFLQILGDDANRDLLDQMIGNFLIVGEIDYAGLEKYQEAEMANGKKWAIDAGNKKIGEIVLAPIDIATQNGHLIQIENIPYFPNEELEKRYLKHKSKH